MKTLPLVLLSLVGLALLVAQTPPASAQASPALALRVPATARTIPVGFIGDSITRGLFTTTPAATLACRDLSRPGLTVVPVNQGHGGARVSDWLPGAPTGYLASAYVAFQATGVRVVHVMLGTNDAAQGVPTATYAANLAALVVDLTAHGYTVVLSDPPASQSAITNVRLVEQEPARAALVNGTTVRRGDTSAYRYFLAHPDQLTGAGLHPDDAGTPVLAQAWAAALRGPVGALASRP